MLGGGLDEGRFSRFTEDRRMKSIVTELEKLGHEAKGLGGEPPSQGLMKLAV